MWFIAAGILIGMFYLGPGAGIMIGVPTLGIMIGVPPLGICALAWRKQYATELANRRMARALREAHIEAITQGVARAAERVRAR